MGRKLRMTDGSGRMAFGLYLYNDSADLYDSPDFITFYGDANLFPASFL
jgi:hypothetical protein